MLKMLFLIKMEEVPTSVTKNGENTDHSGMQLNCIAVDSIFTFEPACSSLSLEKEIEINEIFSYKEDEHQQRS